MSIKDIIFALTLGVVSSALVSGINDMVALKMVSSITLAMLISAIYTLIQNARR